MPDTERPVKTIIILPDPLRDTDPMYMHAGDLDFVHGAVPLQSEFASDQHCVTRYPAPVCLCGRYRLQWVASESPAPEQAV